MAVARPHTFRIMVHLVGISTPTPASLADRDSWELKPFTGHCSAHGGNVICAADLSREEP
jgi:hypothetical protein